MSHYRNSDWGLRDMNDLERLAKSNGMVLHKIVSRMCDVTSTSSTAAAVDVQVLNRSVCATSIVLSATTCRQMCCRQMSCQHFIVVCLLLQLDLPANNKVALFHKQQ